MTITTWHYSNPITPADAAILSKCAAVAVLRSSYDSWPSLKPASIYPYETGLGVRDDEDGAYVKYVSSVNRYNNALGHSMGNLNTDNPNLFLLDANGARIKTAAGTWLMDPGSQKWVDYWVGAVTADILRQPWKATGVFVDGPWLRVPTNILSVPVKYKDDAAWNKAAVLFMQRVSAALHSKGVKVWFNAGGGSTITDVRKSAWTILDDADDHPDMMLEEGAFVTSWMGSFAGFYTEAQCRSTIDTMQAVKNIGAVMASAVNGLPGESGVDNYGKPVTYWDAFYFGLGCFLLGMRENSYFAWHDKSGHPVWMAEFDLDLGAAKGPYGQEGGLYFRHFEKGSVFVNLTNKDTDGAVPLKGHRAVIMIGG